MNRNDDLGNDRGSPSDTRGKSEKTEPIFVIEFGDDIIEQPFSELTAALRNKLLPSVALAEDCEARLWVADYKSTPAHLLRQLQSDTDERVRRAASDNLREKTEKTPTTDPKGEGTPRGETK